MNSYNINQFGNMSMGQNFGNPFQQFGSMMNMPNFGQFPMNPGASQPGAAPPNNQYYQPQYYDFNLP